MQPLAIGIIGCGNISGIYFKNLTTVFPGVRVKACADLDPARARQRAAEHPGVAATTVEGLLADPEIGLVLNLTIPKAHYEVCLRAIEAGKSVYVEKPLSIRREEGAALLEAARARGVRVGAAPDTFLGGGLQTCRKLIEDGAIGRPVAAQAFMLCRGHEGWHPDPEFYYQEGGGPMFDMGPYYLTALATLLGPVRRVTGSARISFPERIIGSEKKRGQSIRVEVPTHVAGILEFASGAVGTIATSFDVCSASVPPIEIFGSEGTLTVPDPNTFGGPVRLRRRGAKESEDLPLTHGHAENRRGLGVADLAEALQTGRAHRAAGDLAYHVLDLMHAFHESSATGRHIELRSDFARTPALPALPAPAPLPAARAALA